MGTDRPRPQSRGAGGETIKISAKEAASANTVLDALEAGDRDHPVLKARGRAAVLGLDSSAAKEIERLKRHVASEAKKTVAAGKRSDDLEKKIDHMRTLKNNANAVKRGCQRTLKKREVKSRRADGGNG